MKHEEVMGRDRGMEFETDDEENLAHGIGGEDDDYYDDNGYTSSSRQSSDHQLPQSPSSIPAWPQSYRQSMDIYTSFNAPMSFKGGSSLGIASSFMSTSSTRRPPMATAAPGYPITKPLLEPTDREEPPITTPKYSAITPSSYVELPTMEDCSNTKAILNAMNVLCGVGLLSTPFAVKEGGWLGLLVLVVYASISLYTGVLLKRCLDSSPGLHTYPDIGQAAFGVGGRIFIAIILYAELYACCVEYIILMADNMSSLFPNANVDFHGVHLDVHIVFAIATTLVILPTVWLRNLSLLSYLSAGGVISTVFVVICLLWVGIVDEVGFHRGGTALNLVNLPVSIGIYSFCYSGHSVFPNIYSSMRERSQFPFVLVVSFIICFAFYTGAAVGGYLMFGDAVKSQFTLNMPKKFAASKIAALTTVASPLSKYALTITPVALSLEELWPSEHLKSHLVPVLIRTLLVFSTLVVGLSLPFFSYLLAFIGSFLAILVSLIFPCACYIKIHYRRLNRLQIAYSVSIIIIGVVCSAIGTYSSVKKIVDKLS